MANKTKKKTKKKNDSTYRGPLIVVPQDGLYFYRVQQHHFLKFHAKSSDLESVSL